MHRNGERSTHGALQPTHEGYFWALKDVSFEIKQGEVVGFIGNNGAGKSTLLKILSRITRPTKGRAEIFGRVGSLLEVGTGFQPELTGRENIYLNGAILGMRKTEINQRFDEIVDFSGIEHFIDTPVKRYSSGMYVRLAFAVAAHLESEILIVDEVLAVGDMAFQKKCLGKVENVANQGRTVLLVSHNMETMSKICGRGILLEAGKIEQLGDMTSVIRSYVGDGTTLSDGFADLSQRGDRSGNGHAIFRSIELLMGSERCTTFPFHSPLTVNINVEVREFLGTVPLAIIISTSDGVAVHDLWNANENCAWPGDPGLHRFSATIPQIHMYPGRYTVHLWLGDYGLNRVDFLKNAIAFEVVQPLDSGSVVMTLLQVNGLVFQSSIWSHQKIAH